jgi:tRNA threonylcarbamoyladenosine modification (KEOPS) complex  Pcc1 subunit
MTKASAVLRINFTSERQKRAIAEGLKPEAAHPAGERACALIAGRGKQLLLKFDAKDSTVLRAILSSYLRMIAASINASNALLELEAGNKQQRAGKS